MFFPCLCHGPIERINAIVFSGVSKEDIKFATTKILKGLVKINLYYYLFQNLSNDNLPELLYVYAWSIGFFIVVTGDWDIVIGFSRLMGFRIRENIPEVPFFQPNLTKFWRNCNATIIDWYFSYYYVPIAKNNKFVNLKLITVFMLIIGMHAFFNSTQFPSIQVILYYVLMGAWFGSTLALSKILGNYLKQKKIKKQLSVLPEWIYNIFYGKSMIGYSFIVFINFNFYALGFAYSPFYKAFRMLY
jgi:D-alanyl-lipoteichoic acid acyltransferase DltB (MBOAT superfamily)